MRIIHTVHPEPRWRKAIETACDKVKKLPMVSNVSFVIEPNKPFPVPGLNPDIIVEGQRSKSPITPKEGGLVGREKMGFGMIQLILNQPGFIKHHHARPEQFKIADRFKLQIYIPREYPCPLGYGILFVREGVYEIPSYPNIMKRKPGIGYWENLSHFSGDPTGDYPDGCMCHNALQSPQNKPVDAIGLIADYLKVRERDFDGKEGERNDQGFDQALYLVYLENREMFNKAIADHKPGKEPGRKRPPPPPPKSKREPRKRPPPPPPPRR